MDKKDKTALITAGYETDPLKLDSYEREPITYEEFIKKFLRELNNKYNTTLLCGKLQTGAGHTRSLGDIFRITNNYYPEVTLKDVRTVLENMSDLVGHYCGDIQRKVYSSKLSNPSWELHSTEDPDEFGEHLNSQSDYIYDEEADIW